MAWVMDAGDRRVVLGGTLEGLGLMGFPRVSRMVSAESYPNPRGDGRRFGRVTRGGQSVSLEVEARASADLSFDEVARSLIAGWRAGPPGQLGTLTAESGRSAYGIPLEIEEDQQNRLFGIGRAVLSFEAVDDLWYGPEEETVIRFAPPVSGGLRFPARAPFRFKSAPSVRNGAVLVSGDLPVHPVFEVRGPVTNPEIDVVGVGKLIFKTFLAYDQTLVVDTRAWARWVKRDGAAFPGALSSAGARLSDMVLSPGSHRVLLRGFDPTNTAELRVRVAPAFTSF
ncbi:hypothetical protein [Leucobacter sp. M11]|uniref:hypothetical protein n=1 Tax=Leucobacter sp. M11 TaxID=2993565 RepID=UPI002D7FE6A3|nr:hypothetical protein [Leucobacter sp. M11]MEB4614005.1 hypothetical protein [Leucobacter sp. M11]